MAQKAFSADELRRFNGVDDPKIYLSIRVAFPPISCCHYL